MSTRFSAANDEIRCAIGACNLTGALSMAVICKKNLDGAWQALMGNHDSSNNGRPALEFNTSNVFVYDTSAHSSTGPTITTAVGWICVGVSRPAGAGTTTRSHYYNGSVWAHANMTGTTNNPLTQAGGTVRFGEYQDVDDLNGWMAVAGECPSELNDAAFETLVNTNRSAWDTAFSAGGVWEFNDNPLVDYSAGGAADETVRTGCSSAVDDPAFYTYGTGAAPVIPRLVMAPRVPAY